MNLTMPLLPMGAVVQHGALRRVSDGALTAMCSVAFCLAPRGSGRLRLSPIGRGRALFVSFEPVAFGLYRDIVSATVGSEKL